MKTVVLKSLFLLCFLVGAGAAFAQSPNLHGKAMSAANDCIQSFAFHGGGLRTVTSVDEAGVCPDGSTKWSVTIYKAGHCPGNQDILCLVIAFPIATVTFDCNENVQSIVCFNSEE